VTRISTSKYVKIEGIIFLGIYS